ncbi:MAG: GTPase Era [Candidatus Omnitrophota bacterium]
MDKKKFKAGFVSIVGKPNVGKSTILNWFFGEKLAIVSSKPETTRDTIRGILTTKDAQIVFIDTPGIHKAHLRLGKEMVKKARSSLSGVDIVLAVVDAARGITEDDNRLLDLVEDLKVPAIALLNKADAMKRSRLLPMIEEFAAKYSFKDIIPISALKGDNMEVLKNKILEYLPEADMYYPKEQITDKDEKFRISEIIREKVLELTHYEVPHSIAVLLDEISPGRDKDIICVKANIFVERDSQKAIVIGSGGKMIKEVGIQARGDIEKLLGKKVFLELWVKVLKNWRSDPRAMKMLGLE